MFSPMRLCRLTVVAASSVIFVTALDGVCETTACSSIVADAPPPEGSVSVEEESVEFLQTGLVEHESPLLQAEDAGAVSGHAAVASFGRGSGGDSPKGRTLVLVVSCHKHKADWPVVIEKTMKVRPDDFLILVGRQPGEDTLDVPYKVSLADHMLLVNASDEYDGLPEKMMVAFHAVTAAPELKHSYSHIFKIDDEDVLDPDKCCELDFDKMDEGILRATGDYFSPELGYQVSHNPEPREWYVGKPNPAIGSDWFAKQIPSSSYWHGHPMVLNGTFTFANGGAGYILSQFAMQTLAEAWPLSSMEKLSRTYVLEDIMVGKTLFEAGVKLQAIHLRGEPKFWQLGCACPLPCRDNSPVVGWKAIASSAIVPCKDDGWACCFEGCSVDDVCEPALNMKDAL